MRGRLCALVLVLGLAGCTSDDDPEPSSGPSSSTSPSSPASPASPAETAVDSLVVQPAAAEMPASWRELFVIPYGASQDTLGTSPGGDSGTLDIGPEYGAPAPDGTWWFLDAAKQRLAHFDADGQYLDAVKIPRKLLVGGRYFQWQLPHVLSDGTLLAPRQTGDVTVLLRLRDGVIDEVTLDGMFAPTYDDSRALYGFDARNKLATADLATGVVERVRTLRTPSGSPFSLRMDFDRARLTVELPDEAVSTTIPIRTASGAKARVGLQVRAGADDTIHLFLVGAGEDDESVQLVGYSSVGPDGVFRQVEPLTDPFSEADPGSPAQLVMAPGSSTPMLVYVLEDGVHVYERAG